MRKYFLIGLIILSISTQSAQARCSRRVSLDAPIQTTTKMWGNLPLEQIITTYYKDNFYKIKLGYLTGWGTTARKDLEGLSLDGVNIQSRGMGYNFWMPSLRYPEVNTISIPHRRPCENGRPEPDQSQYVVLVMVKDLDEGEPGVLITPLHRYKAKMQNDDVRTFVSEEKYNLIKFDSTKAPNPSNDLYRNKEGILPQTYIECSKAERPVPNPQCHARYYYPENNFYVEMVFPADAIPQWREIIDTSMKLLEEWRVKDPQEIKRLTTLMQSQKENN